MGKENKEFIKGLAGFIKWSFDNNKEAGWILSNLSHDILYQVRDKKDRIGFSPRTRSYAKYWDGEKS